MIPVRQSAAPGPARRGEPVNLNFKQIEAFVMVADLGSFRQAAERLNTTQPNIFNADFKSGRDDWRQSNGARCRLCKAHR